MENRDISTYDINTLLQSLDPPAGWQPDAHRALARLKRRPSKLPWVWAAATASAVAFALFIQPGQATCGQTPLDKSCKKSTANYKETGPANARVTIEVYSDYQCPSCAAFYLRELPNVRIVHRDFPLPQHRYAAAAAQYANAAGEAGFYDTVVKQLFSTQAEWKDSGDIDQVVSRVLPREAIQKVRALLPQESLSSDIAMGTLDQVRATPTIILVKDGKREKITAEELDRIR